MATRCVRTYAPINTTDWDTDMKTTFQRTHRSISYHISPRYTVGSPSVVAWTTAQLVMRQERAAYEEMIAGVYGEAKKAQALRLGLRGIVEERWEFRGVLLYNDILTGETGSKPLCSSCGKRHAVGKNTEEAYEPHPEEIKFHPDLNSDYWAPDGS